MIEKIRGFFALYFHIVDVHFTEGSAAGDMSCNIEGDTECVLS